MDSKETVGQRILLAFEGKDRPSEEIIQGLKRYRAAGITLFRSLNIDSPAQVRALTAQLQALAREAGLPPLLIAADQEGGQLMAIGEATHLPGNMALGATGSMELARQAGEVLGRELAALGINVNYAPCVDVNLNPNNPVVGVRSFGDNPLQVARLGAAVVEGIQSQHVAATAKHFPGHGDADVDSHHGLPSVPHSVERLQRVELPPFEGSIQAGVRLIMTAHLALPALDGPEAPPATLSENILNGLLRRQLGFKGLIVTDAMNMLAIQQGERLGEEAVRAVNAGADLILLTCDAMDHERVHRALVKAFKYGRLHMGAASASAQRIAELKAWLATAPEQPDLSVVGCRQHQAVAAEIARRSITRVRDQQQILPLRLDPEQRIAVVIPRPENLTPADTSAYTRPALAALMRERHPNLDEFVIPFAPKDQDIAEVVDRLRDYDRIVIGTLNAYHQPGQQALVRETLKCGIPTVIVALRLPYDLAAFPEAPAYLCTYGFQEPSMQALVDALFGDIELQGRLPVLIPGLS